MSPIIIAALEIQWDSSPANVPTKNVEEQAIGLEFTVSLLKLLFWINI